MFDLAIAEHHCKLALLPRERKYVFRWKALFMLANFCLRAESAWGRLVLLPDGSWYAFFFFFFPKFSRNPLPPHIATDDERYIHRLFQCVVGSLSIFALRSKSRELVVSFSVAFDSQLNC